VAYFGHFHPDGKCWLGTSPQQFSPVQLAASFGPSSSTKRTLPESVWPLNMTVGETIGSLQGDQSLAYEARHFSCLVFSHNFPAKRYWTAIFE
jgi:hypothetical protein